MKPTWKPIPGYELLYDASDAGQIRNYQTGRILRPGMIGRKRRYPSVGLRKAGKAKTIMVHRLVLLTFVGPRPQGKEGMHLNDIPTDNRLVNLQWGTHSENMAMVKRPASANSFHFDPVIKAAWVEKYGSRSPIISRSIHYSREENRRLLWMQTEYKRAAWNGRIKEDGTDFVAHLRKRYDKIRHTLPPPKPFVGVSTRKAA